MGWLWAWLVIAIVFVILQNIGVIKFKIKK